MRLVSRYLLRQLRGPFLFALSALTGFMLLNQVAKKFGDLVGKGLEWSVIVEVFALSVPFIVAMTLPMAVLVAVLYAFSHLAADNEITALRAGGVSVAQILRPVLLWGIVMAVINFGFVDQVLPRSNAQLRALLFEIQRKKPTFALHEQVINEIPSSEHFLRANRIDPATGRLWGVTIYDIGADGSRRITYADSGIMAQAPGGHDLTLRLHSGTVHELQQGRPQSFDLIRFSLDQVRVRDVFDELERNEGDVVRGDREMSTCEMLQVVRRAERDAEEARLDRHALVTRDLRGLLGLPAGDVAPRASLEPRPVGGYCAFLAALRRRILPETAQAQTPAQGRPAAGVVDTARSPGGAAPVRRPRLGGARPAVVSAWAEATAVRQRVENAGKRADRYLVEVHKKFAISASCITFVLVGLVLALRFPRGGMGLVIGGGMTIFAIFYVGLTAGESLADRALLSPALAMWWPNLLLLAVGLAGLVLVNRVGGSGSTRGGDFQEIWSALTRPFVRVARRRRRTAALRAGAPR